MTEDILNLEKKSRLEKLALKIAHLERQKRAIQLRENQKARKVRVRRLIQIGATTLKYLNLPDTIEPVEFEQVIRKILDVQKTETLEPIIEVPEN